MASEHTPADNIVYDLVAVQYHALTAAAAHDQYIKDAHGHQDVEAFFREVKQQDDQRAIRCHELLRRLTAKEGIG